MVDEKVQAIPAVHRGITLQMVIDGQSIAQIRNSRSNARFPLIRASSSAGEGGNQKATGLLSICILPQRKAFKTDDKIVCTAP
jgi:hypothetical protein